MSDLIKRQDAISTIQKYNFDFPQYMERFVTELRDAMKADLEHDIGNLPSAQKKGHWTYKNGAMVSPWYSSYECSECGCLSGFFKYCPECGSRNRGEEE